ncbi:phage tail protein [Ralstonia sp. R-29]|uniref:phage tail protein n=1 Tax=Ralstonia sp. R-29 TaxID=3404059 RepID=UPI003CE6F86C
MDQYLGEIRLCAFSFPPKGWAFCNGALLAINQNAALFSLLSTQYGGDGIRTFALPDLRGRTPLHRDTTNTIVGSVGGVETVTLNAAQMPMHNHLFNASTDAATQVNVGATQNHVLATSTITTPSGPGTALYAAPGTLTALSAETCADTGETQPHENMQPSLVLNYIIALTGIFPSRN